MNESTELMVVNAQNAVQIFTGGGLDLALLALRLEHERAQRAIEEARRREEQARVDARQAQERKDAEAAMAKREADKKLRAKGRAEIIADLVTVNVTGSVEGIADAILAGRVRHVRVVF